MEARVRWSVLDAWLITGLTLIGLALRIPGLGEIAPGAPAELLLFRADPTQDLAALSTLAGVVRGGRWYPRETLDAQLNAYQRAWGGFGQRVALTETLRLAFGKLLPLLFSGDPANAGGEPAAPGPA